MAEKEWQARDKLVQQMSRDGLIEKNLADETMERISKRTREIQYGVHEEGKKLGREHAEQAPSSFWKKNGGQRSAGRKLIREYSEQLGETAEEVERDKILRETRASSVRASGSIRRKLQDKPSKQRLHFEKNGRDSRESAETDSDSYKQQEQEGSGRLKEKRRTRRTYDKQEVYHLPGENLSMMYEKQKIRRAGERQVFRDEYRNLSLEASHEAYRIARKIRRYRRKKLRKYGSDNDEGYEKKIYQGNIYQWKSAFYNPEYTKEKPKDAENAKQQQKKELQKKRAQKIYQEKHETDTFQKSVNAIKTGAKKLALILAANKKIIFVLLAMLGVLLVLFMLLAILVLIIFLAGGNLAGGTVQSDYANISDIEGNFKQMEAELEYRIEHIEEEYPDYDEYIYDVGSIGHDSIMLISYFGAKYGYFTYDDVEAELMEIFNEMYQLELKEVVETRHKIVDGEEVEYDYYILYITLTIKDLEEILEGRLTTEDEKEQWKLYQETGGAQQVYGSPFEFDWRQNISSPFGYRVHPISGDLKFHSGVDIAASGGTPIHSCMNGTVVSAGWSDSYGYNVVIQNSTGYRTKYAHCSKLLVESGQMVKTGMVIAEVGSTGNSTGNHLHLECITVDGKYLDPLYIVSNLYIPREEAQGE